MFGLKGKSFLTLHDYSSEQIGVLLELALYSGVPVYNGLTNQYHPTPILADLLTVKEHLGSLKGKKFIYIEDGRNNMANSLMIGCCKMGMEMVIAAPESLWPEEGLVETCRAYAKESGGSLTVVRT